MPARPLPSRPARTAHPPPTQDAAEERFLEFSEAWGATYPAVVRLRENARAEFVPLLRLGAEIRRIDCTTDAIAPVHARIREVRPGPRARPPT
ncbi:transposase [Streptacidiphilus sp. ASG 303]|uniref:transposase n=1 Tax=Streptacidiphilus sp. ASG 303 TaxID=2896847 RepID=UPI001E5D3CAB|nr:transposase [Streptacidiphilus sp. ASG 303]MCD0483526.1 transposase [Streptacidiphilus sp. ASG 303]